MGWREVKKIYLDMDGVLVDFAGGVRSLCGLEPLSQNDKHRDRSMDDEMWKRIRECDHFYNHLKPLSGAEEMFDQIYWCFGTRCEILTGVPKPERGIVQATEDKIEWVRRVLSKDVKVNVVNWREKVEFCKGEGYILIDDSKKIVRLWNEAGGEGILHTSASETMDRLESVLGFSLREFEKDRDEMLSPSELFAFGIEANRILEGLTLHRKDDGTRFLPDVEFDGHGYPEWRRKPTNGNQKAKSDIEAVAKILKAAGIQMDYYEASMSVVYGIAQSDDRVMDEYLAACLLYDAIQVDNGYQYLTDKSDGVSCRKNLLEAWLEVMGEK